MFLMPRPEIFMQEARYCIYHNLHEVWAEGLKSVYQGESSKNAYARGKKHLQELKSSVRTNAMVIHNMAHHDSPTENNFQMRVVKQISDPLKRQIDESIRIKDSDADNILNSGSEWRGDRIPRASFQTNRVR